MQHNLTWLDRHIAEQSQHSALAYGDSNAVEMAALATELFSEDELEACIQEGKLS